MLVTEGCVSLDICILIDREMMTGSTTTNTTVMLSEKILFQRKVFLSMPRFYLLSSFFFYSLYSFLCVSLLRFSLI